MISKSLTEGGYYTLQWFKDISVVLNRRSNRDGGI